MAGVSLGWTPASPCCRVRPAPARRPPFWAWSLFLSKGKTDETAPLHFYIRQSQCHGVTQKSRILLCTPSNAAVDELLLRIIREKVLDQHGRPHDVNVVRLGESDDPDVAALTLDAQVEARLQSYDAMRRHLTITERVSNLQSRLSRLESHSSSRGVNVDAWKVNGSGDGGNQASFLSPEQEVTHIRAQISQLSKNRRDAEREIEAVKAYLREDIMRGSAIVASTCSGAGKAGFVDLLLKGELSFEVCIIDEASQCSEPSTLVPYATAAPT